MLTDWLSFKHSTKMHTVKIDGHSLFWFFADYSAEVSRRRKEFQPVCVELLKQGLCFRLAFPATLRLQAPNGDQRAFHTSAEAESYLRPRLQRPGNSIPHMKNLLTESREQCSPKRAASSSLQWGKQIRMTLISCNLLILWALALCQSSAHQGQLNCKLYQTYSRFPIVLSHGYLSGFSRYLI